MISRRRFFGITAAAAAAPAMLGAETQPPCLPLPPPIADLKPVKDQATPITIEERALRQEKARRLIRETKLGAILIGPGTSLRYFTGMDWWAGERFFAMVLPAAGNALYVCPAFEEDRARELLAKAPGGARADVRAWQEDEDPYQLLAQGLKDRGLSTGTLGIEETLKYVFSDGVAKAAPQVQIASATPVTAGCRRIKSEHELALMRLANESTLKVFEAVYRSASAGMPQAELERLIAAGHRQLGFPSDVDVMIGEYTAYPHGSITPQIIREGVPVMMDGGCEVEGYQSDITRTFVLGRPSGKMKQVFEIVHHAQSAALRAARPGIEAQAVDAAAREVITQAGDGPGYKFFTHRVGHGIGMDEHEWPYLVRGNTTRLEANMTFSDEPGIYIHGEFGIRLEDDMHITENGAELFTPQSVSLEEPFGKASWPASRL